MQLSDLSLEQRQKLKKVIEAGAIEKMKMKDAQTAYKDMVKTTAEDLGLDASVISQAVNAFYDKEAYTKKSEKQGIVDDIMAIMG